MVTQLDAALGNYARVIRKDLGKDVERVPGAGAAGGLGAGLMAILNGMLVSGIQLVLNVLNFTDVVEQAEVVFTGEGKFDAQSAYGKVPVGIARVCRGLGIPVIVLAGTVTLDSEALHEEGITASFSILNQPMSLKEAMARTAALVEFQAAQVMRLWMHR